MKSIIHPWILFLAISTSFFACGNKEKNTGIETKGITSGEMPSVYQQPTILPTVETPAEIGLEIYSDSKCSLQFPKEWRIEKPGPNKAKFILHAPKSKSSELEDNINLRGDDAGSYNLRDYVDLSLKFLKDSKELINLVVEKKEIVQGNGKEYCEIFFSAEFQKTKMKWIQRIWVVDGKSYILTCTTTPGNFNRIFPEVAKIYNTFKVK